MSTAYLIDMDGVLYRSHQLIPGAKEFVALLIEKAIPFLFLTNNSAPTPEDLVIKMAHLGIPNLFPRHFYTSALNTADFLAETHPRCTVYAVGEAGLNAALNDVGIANDSIAPDYVVIGEGTIIGEKLTKAHECIEAGARLVVTNPDNWCPVGDKKTRPGAGAAAAFLEASMGCRAYYLGKPNTYMFLKASRRLVAQSGKKISRFVMIGDTMETDIRGAIETGFEAYLVLSGSTRLEDIPNYTYQPTRVMENIGELNEELATGVPSDRKKSPALRASLSSHGDRHQTDHILIRRHRPAMTSR
jgi:NagD protein